MRWPGEDSRAGSVHGEDDVTVGQDRSGRIVGSPRRSRKRWAGGPRVGRWIVKNRIAISADKKDATVRQEQSRPELEAVGRSAEWYRHRTRVNPSVRRRNVALREA